MGIHGQKAYAPITVRFMEEALADAVSDVRVELNRIGMNVNQITRHVNTKVKYGYGGAGSGNAALLAQKIGALMG